MKLKRLTFEFKEPLTKTLTYQGVQCTQEEIFQTDVDGIRQEVRKRLKTFMGRLGLLRALNPAAVEMMQMKIGTFDSVFEWMVEFKKTSPTTYILSYPLDLTALIHLSKIGFKFGPLKMKERDLYLFQVLKEKTLTDGFRKFTFREMLLNETDYKITSEEMEGEITSSA